MTKTLPVQQWYVRLERVHDEVAALEAWRQLVRAQGWSAVGEPEVMHDGATPGVIGRVVEFPNLTVNPEAWSVTLPA